MKKEIDLFILWANGRSHEDEVLKLIARSFNIIQKIEITWSEKLFTNNLARFYGKKLPSAGKKKKLCGTGSFLVIAVEDPKPQIVNGTNINLHQTKAQLRKLLGNNYLHASDNQAEAEENLRFLTGENLQDLCQNRQPENSRRLYQDPAGAPTWLDEEKLKQFVKTLPDTTLEYRNHRLFLTTPDIKLLCRYLNAEKPLLSLQKDRYYISLRGKKTPIFITKRQSS